MKFLKYQNFKNENFSQDSKFLVVVWDEKKLVSGVEFAEYIDDRLVIDSIAMNYYGQGFIISDYCEIVLPFY